MSLNGCADIDSREEPYADPPTHSSAAEGLGLLKLLRWAGLIDDPGTRHASGAVIARSYPRGRHLRRLVAGGVRVVINLHTRSHPASLLASLGIEQVHLPVRDFAAPTVDQLRRGVEAVRAAGGPLVVHCGGGYGRTGTLLACLYVADGLFPDEAIDRVRQERPGAIETADQVAAVRAFAVAQDAEPGTAADGGGV